MATMRVRSGWMVLAWALVWALPVWPLAAQPDEAGRPRRGAMDAFDRSQRLKDEAAIDAAARAAGAGPFEYFESSGGLRFDPAVPTPASVLGRPVGERFARGHEVSEYARALAAGSARVRAEVYGRSHQGRPLQILTISSPENLKDLEGILSRNRELADPRGTGDARAAEIARSNPAVVWLSYNVHGNEASCTEAALQVAYTLAAATNPEVEAILRNCVVVIDPLLNPDGRERYVNWFENAVGREADPNPDAAEHEEPWPGGRTNHYLFDLNRDWVWLTQPESRARLAVYRRYMPQLHVDNHEMGHESPYFFGAGDKPHHAAIPAESREWFEMYGKANAEVFDRHGLIYYTRDRFDYLYPGYGKVLPVYHGAVGLLTEQGGHGRAGVSIRLRDGSLLTLADRARGHFLTSMSYLETTAAKRGEQLERFRRFFVSSMSVEGETVREYYVSSASDPAALARLFGVLSAHGVEVRRLEGPLAMKGLRGFLDGEERSGGELPAGSWAVSTQQPMGRLVRALFDRNEPIEDPDTYDISAWSIAPAFGVETYYSMSAGPEGTALATFEAPAARVTGDGRVAVLVDARQGEFPKAVGAAIRHGLSARFTDAPMTIEGVTYAPGSLVVHRVRNPGEGYEAFAAELPSLGVSGHRAATGYSPDHAGLGSDDNRRLELPRILLVRGEPGDANSYGHHWFLLDRQFPIPHHAVNARSLGRMDLEGYNTIVLPDGGDWSAVMGKEGVDRLKAWVERGHALIASGRSAQWAGANLLDLKAAAPRLIAPAP
ncbi:MAG: hypothetical protein IBJ11_10740 [Phycisphaerales bacterium]|nr:hypothetical protein [Phycisphaerales bacterium]